MHRTRARTLLFTLLVLVTIPISSCGGGGGGPGPDGPGQGLELTVFVQAGVDNVALNDLLEFRFSESVDPASTHSGSIQIREGPSFGLTARGAFSVSGSIVRFIPQIPSQCDLSDGGLRPDTEYSVQLIGWPDATSIRNTRGQPLARTQSYAFRTRNDTDPRKFEDEVPGATPSVTAQSPASGAVAVATGSTDARQRVELTLSENVDPCTVTPQTVRLQIHEVGGSLAASLPASDGRLSGFVTGSSTSDQDPRHTTWGSDTGSPWPGGSQTLPTSVHLLQEPGDTRIVICPLQGCDPQRPELGGVFPDNVLIEVTVSSGVSDFAGGPMAPFSMSFVTENLDRSDGVYTIENEGETPYASDGTSADIDTKRAPGVAQAFLLFAGDGDNGTDASRPALPGGEGNDGVRDHFDPEGDFVLDTGPRNTSVNATDGSTAVVWEFASFRIRSGVTVRLIGDNPAIILVQGAVLIEAGATLLGRGDGLGGSPNGRGERGEATTAVPALGGTGVAGGGDGGMSPSENGIGNPRYSGAGSQGYYFTGGGVHPSVFTDTGPGVGSGNTSAHWTARTAPANRSSPGGGGGGHAAFGEVGSALGVGSVPITLDLSADGTGGEAYGGADAGSMRAPEAGSGGGAGAEMRPTNNNEGRGTGGGGGAGGGFIDITALGDIQVFGTIDAAGSSGGEGAGRPFNPNYRRHPGTGGGGGGSGGGVRLITRGNIELGSDTLITTDGGEGGVGGRARGNVAPLTPGGRGAVGRVVLEDADSVITNLALASVIPSEGETGFYRGVFDVSRFAGGGLSPKALTRVFPVGPFNPTYAEAVQADFVVGVPSAASPGFGEVVLFVEAQSFDMQLDGEPEAVGNGFRSIGYFVDSGDPTAPTWNAGHPATLDRPVDNVGHAGIDTMASMNGDEYVQLRFTFFLRLGVGPEDPGTFLDAWTIRFSSDN